MREPTKPSVLEASAEGAGRDAKTQGARWAGPRWVGQEGAGPAGEGGGEWHSQCWFPAVTVRLESLRGARESGRPQPFLPPAALALAEKVPPPG